MENYLGMLARVEDFNRPTGNLLGDFEAIFLRTSPYLILITLHHLVVFHQLYQLGLVFAVQVHEFCRCNCCASVSYNVASSSFFQICSDE